MNRIRPIRTLLLMLCIACTAVVPTAAQKKPNVPIKVYLFYRLNSSGLIDAEQEGRHDSTNDIARELKHDKMIRLLDDEEKGTATVTVEVLSRGNESSTSMSTLAVVHTILRYGDYSTEISGWSNPNDPHTFYPWTFAAFMVADKIEHWIKANYNSLLNSLPPAHDVSPSATPTAQPNASSESGLVELNSLPDGAEVSVDGNFVGNAPASLKLSAGKHTITVTAAGYKTWTRELSVLGGSDVKLSARLERN